MSGKRARPKDKVSSSYRAPSQAELKDELVEALAEVRALDVAQLRGQLTAPKSDLEIDSKEAEVMISILEQKHGRELAKVEDLKPEQLGTIMSLTELLERRLGGPSGSVRSRRRRS